ncbi:DUF87 domain-containing protein [Streptomyces sp. PmtA]|uniref:helicase HerA domain-containing protein n=1 Tax=Streptomyces sp. PmtA TaxID=3074275 RepID=UPI003014B6C0
MLPLRTDHATDPLRALLQAATGMAETESACVQILARPATGRALRRARSQARRLKAGQTPSRLPALTALLLHRAQPSAATGRQDPEHGVAVRQMAAKQSGAQWQCTITYAVACPATEGGARDVVRGRAHALASAFGLYADRNYLARTRLPRPEPFLTDRQFLPRRAALLSVPELAALAHLPIDPGAPGVQRAGARSVLPPPSVAQPAAGNGVKPLGRSDTGARRGVGLAVHDARHHLHVMGATGSGKSTLIANLALDDIRNHRGVIVIDPKGDLVTDLLDRIPDTSADRLVLIDPDDPHTPPCLNVLDGHDIDVVVDNITGIFRRIFTAFSGAAHRRRDARRVPHPAQAPRTHPPTRHPRRRPPPPRRERLPAADRPRPQGPRAARILGLVRVDVRTLARGRGRAGDEQTARLPPAGLRPPGDLRRPLHLRPRPGPRRRHPPRPPPQRRPR